MEGQINWQVLDGIAELLAVPNIELLIVGLEHIKHYQRMQQETDE